MTRWSFTRRVEETYAEILVVTMTAEQLATLGYASTAAAIAGLAQADVRLEVPALSEALAAEVAVAEVDGEVKLTLTWSPPVSMTDTVQSHACRVVHEPGSPTSERLICEGAWTVLARESDP